MLTNSSGERPRRNWIACSVDVAGQHVGVSVRNLDEDERRRMAAQIAWFAEGMITPGVELDATGWPAVLEAILARDVAITLDDDRPVDTDDFWNQVVCRAFEVFVTANGLRPTLKASVPERPAG
jgi:hypothetical protein